MSLSNLRLVEFAAATLLSVVVLLVAIAPALFAAAPAAGPAGGLRGTHTVVIEYELSPEWRLA